MQAIPALIAKILLERGWMLATAESCTGGMIAAACTDLAGSSQWFERGFVTYSNAAKTELLGVDPALISDFGAVSEPVVRAMAAGALTHSNAQVALAVTGIAGPGGGSADKPLGGVWFGFALDGQVSAEMRRFEGDRAQVRQASVAHALGRLLDLLSEAAPDQTTPIAMPTPKLTPNMAPPDKPLFNTSFTKDQS